MSTKLKGTFSRLPSIKRRKCSFEKHFIAAIKADNIPEIRKLLRDRIQISSPLTWSSHGSETLDLIHIVCAMGSLEAVKLVLRLGAVLELRTSSDLTPLHFACKYNRSNPEVTEHLLKIGAKINALENSRDYTPLHCACAANNYSAAKILLNHSADVESKDIGGRTPRDTAKDCGFVEIVELFDEFTIVQNQKDYLAGLPERVSILENCVEVLLRRFIERQQSGHRGSQVKRVSDTGQPCALRTHQQSEHREFRKNWSVPLFRKHNVINRDEAHQRVRYYSGPSSSHYGVMDCGGSGNGGTDNGQKHLVTGSKPGAQYANEPRSHDELTSTSSDKRGSDMRTPKRGRY